VKDPTSFDGITTPVGDYAYEVETQQLSMEQVRANPSFSRPVQLYDKWCALPGTIPHHNTITPSLIGAEILSEMYILDVLTRPDNYEPGNNGLDNDDDMPWDFRWRLFGTTHSERYGKEATGVLLSDAATHDKSAAGSFEVAQHVMKTHEAAFFLTKFCENGAIHKTTSTVVMPLADDNGAVCRLFGCSAWSKF